MTKHTDVGNTVTAGLQSPAWPPLKPFDTAELPEFPIGALPGVLAQWVSEEAHATQTPPDLAGLLALSTCAAMIARRVEVEARPNWREPTNIFVVVLLPPGNRKSAVFADAMRPLRAIEAEAIDEARPAVAVALSERHRDERRLKKLEKLAAEKGDSKAARQAGELAAQLSQQPRPVLPRLLVDDATSEELERLLAQQQGRLMSASPEGGPFDLMAGRYSKGGADFVVYLKSHAGDDLVTDRVTREPVRIERPALTCCYTVQPGVIEGLSENPAFRARGMLGRFLYAVPTSPVGSREIAPDPMSEQTREAYWATIRALASGFGNIGSAYAPIVLPVAPGAAATKLIEWEHEVESMLAEGGRMEHFTDWGGKLVGLTLRLAGILHCVSYGAEGQIDAHTLAQAIEIARYAIPHADRTLNLMRAAEVPSIADGQYLLRWIVRHGKQSFTKSEAQHHGKRRFPHAHDIDAALSELGSRGYIRPIAEEQTGPGRPPSPRYEVRPDVFQDECAKNRSRYSCKGDSGNNGSAARHVQAGEREEVVL